MKNEKTPLDGLSLTAIAAQMNMTRETARRRFSAAGVEVSSGKRYSLTEIRTAFHDEFSGKRDVQDPFRLMLAKGATAGFSDSWNRNGEDGMKQIALSLGLTEAQFEQLACKWFGALAIMTAAFPMFHSDDIFDFAGAARHFRYTSATPEIVTIYVPEWIRTLSRKHGMAGVLDHKSVSFDRSEFEAVKNGE
jgi:hypothetical protein